MAKFYGPVGYAEYDTVAPGRVTEKIIERKYYGDIQKYNRKLESSNDINDNINVSMKISIVADAYAYDHFFAIRYVKYAGATWKVIDISPERPRLILTIGGLYNAH